MWLASGDDLGLELGAVFAPTRSANASFIKDSVHVSTLKLSGHEAPTKTNPHQDASPRRLLLTNFGSEFKMAF
jgi:hypothetical protein